MTLIFVSLSKQATGEMNPIEQAFMHAAAQPVKPIGIQTQDQMQQPRLHNILGWMLQNKLPQINWKEAIKQRQVEIFNINKLIVWKIKSFN